MPAIYLILAKVLTLTDAFLNYFVTTTGTFTTIVAPGVCGTCNVVAMDAGMTTCGTEVVGRLICLIDAVLGLAPGLLGAVFAT